MEKTKELKIVVGAFGGLLILLAAQSAVLQQRLKDSGSALSSSISTIDMVAKQRDWLMKENQIIGTQRDIAASTSETAINLLNKLPQSAKTADDVKSDYLTAKSTIIKNSSVLGETNKQLADLENHRP